jgi:hypothetical protein
MSHLMVALGSLEQFNGRGVSKISSNNDEPSPRPHTLVNVCRRRIELVEGSSRPGKNRTIGGIWPIIEKSIYCEPRQTHTSNNRMMLTNLVFEVA